MVEGYPKYAYSPCPRHMQLAWSVKVKPVIKGGLKKGIFGKTLFKIFSFYREEKVQFRFYPFLCNFLKL